MLKEERERKLNNWEKERIKYHTKIGLTKPAFGEIINNTIQIPEETVKIILDFVNKNK